MNRVLAQLGNQDTPDLPSELDIVDTFTKLIFGDEAFSGAELATIEALRMADHSIALDDFAEMGGYLRVLGVPEMIKLVSRVQLQLCRGGGMPSALAHLAAESRLSPH
jgi:hypothetical protein